MHFIFSRFITFVLLTAFTAPILLGIGATMRVATVLGGPAVKIAAIYAGYIAALVSPTGFEPVLPA